MHLKIGFIVSKKIFIPQMIIDNDLLNKLAYLCRLELLPHERDTMLHDLNEMVDWVNELNELDVDNSVVLEEASQLEPASLRSDAVVNLLSHKQALALAPSSDSNYFRVPSVKGVSTTDLEETS